MHPPKFRRQLKFDRQTPSTRLKRERGFSVFTHELLVLPHAASLDAGRKTRKTKEINKVKLRGIKVDLIPGSLNIYIFSIYRADCFVFLCFVGYFQRLLLYFFLFICLFAVLS